MMNIANKSDLCVAYRLLLGYIELCKEHPITDPYYLALRADYIRELKQDIRRYTNKPLREDRYIDDGDNYESYIHLLPLPENITTEEQAEEWFMENEYLPIRYTYYSPTGWLFTHWHKLVFRHGKWWVYHCVGMDC